MQEIYILIEKVGGDGFDRPHHRGERDGQGDGGPGRPPPGRTGATTQFVSINCAALPENLLESELFGHAKRLVHRGRGRQEGHVRGWPSGGRSSSTRSGEMSPWTQVKLLRALQERKVRRVGGTEEIPVDVRIIAATNQDLKKRIQEGKFREELFYRLNVISFDMPPLRKRVEDIPHPRRPFPPEILRQARQEAEAVHARGRRPARGLSLAGQHPRARERHRADRGHRGPGDGHGELPAQGDHLPAEEEARDPVLLRAGLQPDPHLDEITKKYVIQALLPSRAAASRRPPLSWA